MLELFSLVGTQTPEQMIKMYKLKNSMTRVSFVL